MMALSRKEKVIQWNCRSIFSKKDELLKVIKNEYPLVLAIQETMLRKEDTIRIPHYFSIQKEDRFNRRQHGRVALFIHETVTTYAEINLNTELQAVAVKLKVHRKITLCSVYVTRSQIVTEQMMTELVRQLPPSVIIMGDFNAYHQLWGNTTTDARGRYVEDFITSNSLNIINDGNATRTTHHSETAIDLTIISPCLEP